MIPELPPSLPADLLQRRSELPLKPDPVTINGTFVQLRPLDLETDLEPLYRVSNGQSITVGERQVDAYDAERLIWRYLFAGPFATLAEFRAYCSQQIDAANARCLCVVDQASGHPVGMINLMSNSPEHLKIELGGIWYSPLVQGTKINTEATYLLLEHAFGLGYQRLEWKCNARNERSRRTALRMGFRFEGVQESHMIIKGRVRDTAWYRILAAEWPAVAARLRAFLYNG
jgi:RimJ/RimL family protein N-acetyltransferase